MRSTDFDVTRARRNATALLVLGEAGGLDQPQREALLQAMWAGWRRVMAIKLGATLYRDCLDRRDSGGK